MPLPLLAHQAPVLPLKLWRPATFNGTALVLGSMAPDLEYLPIAFAPHSAKGFAHSLVGQVLFCLPVALSAVWLIGRFRVGEVVASRLGSHFAWLSGAATDIVRPRGLARASMCVLIGSFSHLALDALTHTVLPAALPDGTWRVGRLLFSAATVLQIVVSLGGALVSVWLLRRIARSWRGEVPRQRSGSLFIAVLATIGAALGVAGARPAIHNPDDYFFAGSLYVWGFVAFFVACGAGLGVLIAGLILGARDARSLP